MLDGAVFFAIIKEENEVIWMVQDRNPEYFLAIASEKSISKAAERLHISQPYLSQYVIHLEKEFGVRLLDRTKSPLALTAAGKVYANYLEDSSQLYEQLLQDFTRLNASRRQTLRVAMSNWRASTLLPSILPAFSQEHPEAHLELLERPTSEMFRLVADNTVDFAIMNTNLNTPDYLTTETILYEKILLVGNRGNRAAQALAEACRAGREPELSVLEHERFVLLYPEILLAMRVNNFLEREHITVENALYTTNATTALNLTAENYGFCFVNETAVHNAPNRGELLFFDLDSPDLVHPLSVVYKKKRHLLPRLRRCRAPLPAIAVVAQRVRLPRGARPSGIARQSPPPKRCRRRALFISFSRAPEYWNKSARRGGCSEGRAAPCAARPSWLRSAQGRADRPKGRA